MYKTYSFRGRGIKRKKKLIPYTFNILIYFLSFSWQIIYLENVDVYTFWGGGESEKVYILYTHLNVDNYGRPFNYHTGHEVCEVL